MANKNNIVKGAPDWNIKVNDFMNEYFGNDSGFVTSGITYVNGATVYKNDSGTSVNGIQELSSASGIGFATFGAISIPASIIDSSTGVVTDDGNTVPLVKFPTNVGNETTATWYALCTGGIARLAWNADHTISIYPYSFMMLGEKPSTGTLWLDISHIYAIHE